MTPEETIEGIADYVRASVEAIDADLSKRLSAIDMEDMEAAHETADDMLADALERLGFSESALVEWRAKSTRLQTEVRDG